MYTVSSISESAERKIYTSLVTFLFGEYFLHQNDKNMTLEIMVKWIVFSCVRYIWLEFSYSFRVKM